MTTTKLEAPKAGDVVLYTPHYKGHPLRTNIAKVTPAGWLKVRTPYPYHATTLDHTVETSWKLDGNGVYKPTTGKDANRVYLDVAGKFEELEAAAVAHDAERAAKAKDDADRRAAHHAEEAAKEEHVRKLLGGSYLDHTLLKEELPDGTLLLLVALPVKPEMLERKKGYERVLIRLTKTARVWDEGKPWELGYTYAHGGTSSMSSISTTDHATPDAAVWAALTDAYYRW